jgi:hypothetical protein
MGILNLDGVDKYYSCEMGLKFLKSSVERGP